MDLMKLRELASNPASALEIGKAAEHLVVADLTLQGYRAFLTDQGLPYDVIVDIGGRLIRMQVKAACFARNVNMRGRSERTAYTFYVRKIGKLGKNRLKDEHCDLVALVGLDVGAIGYLPLSEAGMTCQLMPPGFIFKGRYKRNKSTSIDKMPFIEALKRCQK